MTEEFHTDDLNPNNEVEQTSPKVPVAIRRTYIIAFIMLVLTLFDSASHYREFGAWQILADGAGVLVALLLVIASYLLYRRGNIKTAGTFIAFTIFSAYLPGDLFLEGVTFYNMLSGVILFILLYFIFRPESASRWFQYAVIYVVTSAIFSVISTFDRFNINDSQSWSVSLPVTTSLLVVLMLWQILANIQVRTIRTRLLLIFMGIGLVPALLISATSTAIGYQRDITQAENSLNTTLALKSEQVNSWRQQLNNDFASLQQNEEFIGTAELYRALFDTDSFYLQIYRQDLNNILGSYAGEDTNFNEIAIVNLEGEVLLSTQPENENVNLSGTEPFESGMAALANTALTFNETEDQIEFTIAQPLFNQNQEVIAVLLGEANTTGLTERMLEALQFTQAESTYLISEQQDLLTPIAENESISIGTSLSLDFLMSDETGLGMTNLQTYTNLDGTQAIGVAQLIPAVDAYLIVEQVQAEAFQTLRLNLIINSILAGLTVFAIFFSSLRSARNISTPLFKLSNDAAMVTRNELDLIEPIDRADEIGELSQSLSTMTGELFQTKTNLENIVAERTKVLERRAAYLETTSEISKALTGIYNLEDLLNTVAFLISENFGFYHVGIFLLDAKKEYAELKSANSEGGWRMLAREHKLKVGEQGIVGFVTGSGLPRIQQQVEGEESVHYNNPDLPLTKSELALPLKAGNEIFGALDVQSTEESAFSDEDVSALQVLADSVGIAIQTTRLVQQLQESLETERKIYGDLTSSSWRAMLASAATLPAFKSDQFGIQTISDSTSPLAQKATETGQVQVEPASDHSSTHHLAVPITVRGGTVVAVIETEKPASSGQWTTEEITILESVGTELGMAIENARLFEETQKTAQRDRISANLASKIWASTDVENILQTAVRELGSALNISYGTIKLKLPKESETNGHSNDGVDQ